MDGGVRLGTDVLKALALGARAVFIGRPVIWGLAYQVDMLLTRYSCDIDYTFTSTNVGCEDQASLIPLFTNLIQLFRVRKVFTKCLRCCVRN